MSRKEIRAPEKRILNAHNETDQLRRRAAEILERAGIIVTPRELEGMEIARFGLDEPERTGLQIIVYENNERYCAKELVMLPCQTCPEHRHPPTGGGPGKMETFRCRWGRVTLCVEGATAAAQKAKPPAGSEKHYTVFHEIELQPGGQFTVPPDTLHWFQAGPDGAVVSEFSSTSSDETDVFTDPRIVRLP